MNIEKLVGELNLTCYKFNKEKKIFNKKITNYKQIQEIVSIVELLTNNNIKYMVDSDNNIVLT